MIPAEQINEQAGFWAEHGLAGLVIFTLFGMVGGVLYLAKMEFKSYRTEHAEERKEWYKSSEVQTGKLELAFKELSAAIRENRLR